jgi:hypothetical protein
MVNFNAISRDVPESITHTDSAGRKSLCPGENGGSASPEVLPVAGAEAA